MHSYRGGHETNLLPVRHSALSCGQSKNDGECSLALLSATLSPSPSHTQIYRNAGEIVACMDWTSVGYQLGLLTIANRQSPMTRFVMHGSTARYVLVLDFLGYISSSTLPHTHLRPGLDPHARPFPSHPPHPSLIHRCSQFSSIPLCRWSAV